MILYKTVAEEGKAEQIIEKSRFIAYVRPALTREEADNFIAEIKAKHKDATHNVPAIVIGNKFQIQWASDDGEPQGTSGAPIVQMLVKMGVTNVVIVVTRYFGGIKLGTGGLVRAYTNTAKLGMEAAGICSVKEMAVLEVKVGYPFLNKFQSLVKESPFTIDSVSYGEAVIMTLATEVENIEDVRVLINNITSGTGKILDEKNMLRKV